MKTKSIIRLTLTQYWLIKTWREKSSYVLTSYQNTKKLPLVYLIIYHRYLNESKWYLQGHFYFHWLEIQQVGEVLEKTIKLQKRRVTPFDLKLIHKIYTSLKQTYPDNFNRRNYFLAACSLFFVSSDNLNYDILIKLRPYGGLLGIDNSSLDKYLKNCKNLRLHAISLNAAGFIHEIYQQVPTNCYMLPRNCNNSLLGHLSGIAFCLFIKLKKPELYHLLK